MIALIREAKSVVMIEAAANGELWNAVCNKQPIDETRL